MYFLCYTIQVILRSPYVGLDFISLSKYKQMVGRAGRSGFGSEGESFLICQTTDLEKVRKLLQSQMDETTSKLDVEACKDLVLSSIGLGTATTRRTLRELLARSLLHVQVLLRLVFLFLVKAIFFSYSEVQNNL